MTNINVPGNSNTINITNTKKKTVVTVSISLAVIIIFATFLHFSAFNSLEKKIVGTWQLENTEQLYEFTNDGQFIYLSGSSNGASIKYKISDKKIRLSINYLGGNATVFADINIKNNTMTLSNFIDPDNFFNIDIENVLSFTKIN